MEKFLQRTQDPARLLKELEYTRHVLAAHPPLAFHFQLLIGDDGRVYHLDLDRWPVDDVGSARYNETFAKELHETAKCLRQAGEEVREVVEAAGARGRLR